MPMRPVTVRRWEVVIAFVILFASYIIMGVYLKNLIDENARTKASVITVERGNCRTREFLLSAAKFRESLAKNDTSDKKKKIDSRAARTSLRLANGFSNDLCLDTTTKGVK